TTRIGPGRSHSIPGSRAGPGRWWTRPVPRFRTGIHTRVCGAWGRRLPGGPAYRPREKGRGISAPARISTPTASMGGHLAPNGAADGTPTLAPALGLLTVAVGVGAGRSGEFAPHPQPLGAGGTPHTDDCVALVPLGTH